MDRAGYYDLYCSQLPCLHLYIQSMVWILYLIRDLYLNYTPTTFLKFILRNIASTPCSIHFTGTPCLAVPDSWYNDPSDCAHKYEGRGCGWRGCPIVLSWGTCSTAVGLSINRFKPEQISDVTHGASERYLISSHGRVGKAVSLTWHGHGSAPLSSLSGYSTLTLI